MRNAREFMAEESRQVAAFLGRQADLTAGMGDSGADCTENYLGLGQELPEVVGETAWYEQYVPSGGSDRFRGSPEKIRDVAGSWRHAGVLMQRFLEDAQACFLTASKAHSGEAADAFQTYVKHSVGLTCPPAKAEDGEPLVTNLVAACTQIAKACDRYAEHVEAAMQQQFRAWMNGLQTGGFAGGGGPLDPDNAYQLRVSGYPEREVPLLGSRRGLMVDGIRPLDGYLVEAKQIRDPDCTNKSFRTLDRVEEALTKPVKVNKQGKIGFDPSSTACTRATRANSSATSRPWPTPPTVRSGAWRS